MTISSVFYTYTHTSTDGNNYALAYKPPGGVERGVYEELLVQLCTGPKIPDAIALISTPEECDEIKKIISANSAPLALERLRGRIPFLIVSYCLADGKTKVELLDKSFESRKEKLCSPLRTPKLWMRSGLLELFKEEAVVLRAPSGYAYEKPSGARASVFLKPDLALTSSPAIAFVALAVFEKCFSGNSFLLKNLRTIFLDTMAIAPVAYELRQLLSMCTETIRPRIESFHSYGGFAGIRQPMSGTSFCIISASTSMDLHEKWITQKEVSPSEVLTLITTKAAAKYKNGALVAIDCSGLEAAKGPPQLSIRIRGESFLPEQEPSKKVLLTEQNHKCPDDVDTFQSLSGQGIFDIFRRSARSAAKTRALFVDGGKLIDTPRFQEWLETHLPQTVKASTNLIVHQDDNASAQLAIRIKNFCREKLGLDIDKKISISELRNVEIKKTSGVIACGAVIGKGSQLLEISRLLREIHDGPRLFVIGFQVAEFREETKGIILNLKHSKGIPHEIIRFGKAAIGTQLLASYEQEQQTYYQASRELSKLPAVLASRGRLLGGVNPFENLSLLPHGRTLSNRMQLKPGFAFWPPNYSNACQPSVIATVAVILQRAREEKAIPEEKRLGTASYRHVILDPENFARYNDGVIQSALLRAAYPSELDYRSDISSSAQMKSIIVRSLEKSDADAGESALEFIAALAMKRLQLTQHHFKEIVSAVRKVRKRAPRLAIALSFLLAPEHVNSNTGETSKIPF